VCAERSAVLQMVAAGERDPVALAVATRGPVAAAPCGMCRQTLAEFAIDLPIRLIVAGDPGETALTARTTSLEALLPEAFRGDALRRG
jgi:cytidine deaminase